MNYGKSIDSYLRKIDAGNPIPYLQFLKILQSPDLNLNFKSSDIKVRKVSGTLYRVTQLDPALREELNTIVTEQFSDRVSGAKQNRSHAYSVNGSMLLCRDGNFHPYVVMFDTDGHYTPQPKCISSALLIENRQNFICIDKTLPFVAKHCGLDPSDLENMVTIFTEGNAISNILHKQFLSQFEKIYLLLDVDSGGLQIASNIISMLPYSKIRFLVPTDIHQRLEKVRASAAIDAIEKSIKLGARHPQLTHVARLIHTTQRELEQESYLDD